MTRAWMGRLLAAFAVVGLTVSAASADEGAANLTASLSGFQDAPPILTDGTGSFSATVQGSSLTYRLTYSGMATPVFMAHIHFGQSGVNGGIFLWLCGSAAAPGPAGTPTCPPTGGTVSRTVSAADIVSIGGQNVSAGDFAGALRIIRSRDGYVNVHTTQFPAGEIRGQVHVGESSD